MEFPIGKNLFHLVVNPSTSRYPTVDLVQTGTNYEKRVNKKHEIPFGNSNPGKWAYLFTFSTFSGNFPAG